MRLDADKRCEVIAHLVECVSVRGTARLCGVYKRTVTDLLLKVGEGCKRLHDRLVRGLAIHRVETDELFATLHTREKNLKGHEPAEYGHIWTFTALATTSKLLIAYRTGKRTQDMTDAFMWDLRSRLTVMPELVTDGLPCYPPGVERSFGNAVDYAVLIKTPARKGKKTGVPFVQKRRVVGAPDMEHISTSYIERHNSTIRDCLKRFARRSRCHSKKVSYHEAAIHLFACWYNFVRMHETLKTVPAVAARLAESPWKLSDLVEAALAEPEGFVQPAPEPLEPRPGQGPTRTTATGTVLRLMPSPSRPQEARQGQARPVLDRANRPPLAKPKPAPRPKQLSLFDE